jgi:uncharacterized protein YndB with AHSA1/START domain
MSAPEILTAKVRIAAPPAAVFPYLVDPALMIQWIGQWADLQPEPGGLFALDVEQAAVRGRFVSVEPPTRVVFTWGVPGSDVIPAGSTTVEIVLTADGLDTVVELFHHDLPPDEQSGHRFGWTTYLDRLVRAVAADPSPT